MAALHSRCGHHIFVLWFFFLSSIFFSLPSLSRCRLDVYHSSIRGVALVQVWNVLHVARWKYRMPKIAKNSPSWHHRTTLSGYIFATKTHIDNRKKNLVSSNSFSTCPDSMVNFGLLAAEIVSLVWGIPTNFNGFRVFAALYCTAH